MCSTVCTYVDTIFTVLAATVSQKSYKVFDGLKCLVADHVGCMVHVTSYSFFFAKIRGLPSQNSVHVREHFRRASVPALQTGHRNIPTAKHFPRVMVVLLSRRDYFHPLGESGLAVRLGRRRVV